MSRQGRAGPYCCPPDTQNIPTDNRSILYNSVVFIPNRFLCACLEEPALDCAVLCCLLLSGHFLKNISVLAFFVNAMCKIDLGKETLVEFTSFFFPWIF